jgi:bifunctional UDP-N-acetylglucosamine pyrophosphorylase/glucosamine-1-phosphate N-acetyltransferase
MTIQPIILAAGKGTRMGNPDLPKHLTPLRGKPLIAYLLDTLRQTDFLPPVLVVGHGQDQIRAVLGDSYLYIVQEELLGTGHALACCTDALRGKADIFLVINGDHPLFTVATFCRLTDEHMQENATMSLATLVTDEPAFDNFGRIIRDQKGDVVAIREKKDCSPEELLIREYNPALYAFSDSWVWDALPSLTSENSQHELYLTDLLAQAIRDGRKVATVDMPEWQEALGVNTPEQLAEVEKYLA